MFQVHSVWTGCPRFDWLVHERSRWRWGGWPHLPPHLHSADWTFQCSTGATWRLPDRRRWLRPLRPWRGGRAAGCASSFAEECHGSCSTRPGTRWTRPRTSEPPSWWNAGRPGGRWHRWRTRGSHRRWPSKCHRWQRDTQFVSHRPSTTTFNSNLIA